MSQVVKHFHKPWKLLVSVCLSRMNVISRELTDIEQRYSLLQEQIELEQSVYNDYEHKKMSLQEIEKKKTHNLTHEEEATVMDASRELAAIQDQEDIWANVSKKVSVSSNRTAFDGLTSNRTSLQRHLDGILHFVVKDCELLNQETSLYPYDTVMPDENLKMASERILESHGINSSNMIFLSNAPVGIVKIRFKEDEQRGKQYQGAKVFFTKAQLKYSPTLFKEDIIDNCSKPYEWLTLNELQQYTDNEYFKRVERFLQ